MRISVWILVSIAAGLNQNALAAGPISCGELLRINPALKATTLLWAAVENPARYSPTGPLVLELKLGKAQGAAMLDRALLAQGARVLERSDSLVRVEIPNAFGKAQLLSIARLAEVQSISLAATGRYAQLRQGFSALAGFEFPSIFSPWAKVQMQAKSPEDAATRLSESRPWILYLNSTDLASPHYDRAFADLGIDPDTALITNLSRVSLIELRFSWITLAEVISLTKRLPVTRALVSGAEDAEIAAIPKMSPRLWGALDGRLRATLTLAGSDAIEKIEDARRKGSMDLRILSASNHSGVQVVVEGAYIDITDLVALPLVVEADLAL